MTFPDASRHFTESWSKRWEKSYERVMHISGQDGGDGALGSLGRQTHSDPSIHQYRHHPLAFVSFPSAGSLQRLFDQPGRDDTASHSAISLLAQCVIPDTLFA